MKAPLLSLFAVILVLPVIFSGCRSKETTADIPDIQTIYGNIHYLDSIIRSGQIDSIGNITDQMKHKITSYTGMAASAEERAVLDSLDRIWNVAHGFMQFCAGTRSNLDMLEQDARSVENLYKSGKIKITTYTASLLEAEQVLVDLRIQLSEQYRLTLHALRDHEALVKQLPAVTIQGN